MNLRQVRKKTKSVSNVKKITRSMQLVSAIKMKRAQQAAHEARPYQEHIEAIISRVMYKKNDSISPLLLHPKNNSKKLVILISANKGLCGSFNIDLLRYLMKNSQNEKADYIVVGKKAASFVSKLGETILADFSSNQPQNNVSALFTMTVNSFLSGKYSHVTILYNKFISTLKTETVEQTLLPFSPSEKTKETDIKQPKNEYLFEPGPEEIIDSLLKSYLEDKIRNCIIQSEAGEHSARMIAMKNATDNANDVIYNLTLLGNKLRQEKITSELLDMITAKESVSSI
jgi:F-type H+-transporting ATPase subunit gamma